MCTNIRRKSAEKELGSFQRCPVTRGNRHKLEHKTFFLYIRKRFFPVRVTKHWHRLPREAVQASSLEILKIHLDNVLGNCI